MAINQESTPTVPTEIPVDTKKMPTPVPVGPDGMTDYIRQPKAEIQSEAKDFLAKLRSDIDGLLHPQHEAISTPDVGSPVTATNEVGVKIYNVSTTPNTTVSATVNPGNTIEPNPSGNATSPGAVPSAPSF